MVVFLLDGRVRKIESVTAVFEFLDYKKSYVKHISHELHTPLNAATLGLNMAIIRMNKHKNSDLVDDGLIETLSGIRLACNAAVNSLNEFLFSGRVQSGILELCLESTPVVDFVCEAINTDLLSEQAITKNVALDVLFQVDAAVLAMYPTAVPLRSFDCLSCDRSKMDQVLQKLVSNAIKYSQEDSTITIRAFFCPSVGDSPTSLSMTADEDMRRLRPLTIPESVVDSERTTLLTTEQHSGNNSPCIDKPRSEGKDEADGRLIIGEQNALNINDNEDDALVVEAGDIVLNGISTETKIDFAFSGDSWTARRSADGVSKRNSSSRPSPSPCPYDVDGVLVITVSDTGQGLSEEHKKTLFRGVTDHRHRHDDTNNDEQQSTDGVSGRSGSGFGLFISRCIVDLHGGNFPLNPLPSTFTHPHLSLSFTERLLGSIGVSSAGEGQGSTFTLTIPMTRRRGSDRVNHRRYVLRGSDFHGSPFQPSPHSQQQINDRINNNNKYDLVDMKDVFQSRMENGGQNDHRARFFSLHSFNVNTVLSQEQEIGTHANGTRRAYRHYPQHHRHPARRSFTFVKDVLPDSAAGVGDADDPDNSGNFLIPSLLDNDDDSVQQPQHTTLPITSHHIQMMQQLQPPSSDGSALSPSSVGTQSHTSYRLLVLDECNLLCTALRLDGHHCDEAKDVSTALAMINKKLRYGHYPGSTDHLLSPVTHYSVVAGGADKAVSDYCDGNDMYDAVIIALPDGPSICKCIRALSANVAIFGVTNTVFFHEDSRLYKAYGATAVLVKPFDMAFFMTFLRHMEELESDC